MVALKKLIGDVEVNKDLLLLLVIGGLYSLSIALSNTFVNVYLWKQSGEFSDLGFYNLAVVIFQPLTFILAGRWAKKIDRVIVLRLGVVFLALFYLSVLFIGDQASTYLLMLGSLLGIGYGFYWLAFNVLTFEITEPETRDFFNGFLGILSSVGGMIGPFAAGYIISNLEKFTGYTVIFTISLVLFSAAVVLSLFIKRRGAEGSYELKRIIKERRNNDNWRYITNAHFFQGLREGTFIFAVSVLVYITTNSEMALGTFGLLNSAVAFVAYYFATRLIKKHHRKKAILIGGLILYGAIFFLVFELTYVKLLFYAVTIAIAYPLLLVPYVSLTYDVIGRSWKAGEMRIEYIVVREIFLNGGRAVSVILFLIAVLFFDQQKSIPVLMCIIGAGHAMIYPFVRKIELEPAKPVIKEEPHPIVTTLRDGEGESKP
ncbi:YQGE family putative transporter [Bacillus tianshenii]|uniref:YQGE family putative transporter n=1 Tax=Sutcliffiella tianshenii TaxID=1463404 RepID=A0ABS2P005_9BACI|nr:MFS transporter [Bacillus tianshenii]MBM7620268.1 YQGE family putative transporter [Bacillus tianshenii]